MATTTSTALGTLIRFQSPQRALGAIKCQTIMSSSAQVNMVPLSETIVLGLPRHAPA
jgi:hypothetical protein